LSGEVEVVDRPGVGQAGEQQPRGEPAFLGGVDLDLQQPLERGGHRQVLLAGLVEDPGQAAVSSIVRSTTQRTRPSFDLSSIPRRAIRTLIPRRFRSARHRR
jgi:hypothetical protein